MCKVNEDFANVLAFIPLPVTSSSDKHDNEPMLCLLLSTFIMIVYIS